MSTHSLTSLFFPREEKTTVVSTPPPTMHLMYTLDPAGKRIYTLKKVLSGEVTKSAHPARFSPDDKWSRQRVTMKKRYGLLILGDGEFHENKKKSKGVRGT